MTVTDIWTKNYVMFLYGEQRRGEILEENSKKGPNFKSSFVITVIISMQTHITRSVPSHQHVGHNNKSSMSICVLCRLQPHKRCCQSPHFEAVT